MGCFIKCIHQRLGRERWNTGGTIHLLITGWTNNTCHARLKGGFFNLTLPSTEKIAPAPKSTLMLPPIATLIPEQCLFANQGWLWPWESRKPLNFGVSVVVAIAEIAIHMSLCSLCIFTYHNFLFEILNKYD